MALYVSFDAPLEFGWRGADLNDSHLLPILKYLAGQVFYIVWQGYSYIGVLALSGPIYDTVHYCNPHLIHSFVTQRLGINKSTLWYIQKHIKEGKRIKVYKKIMDKESEITKL